MGSSKEDVAPPPRTEISCGESADNTDMQTRELQNGLLHGTNKPPSVPAKKWNSSALGRVTTVCVVIENLVHLHNSLHY